eukprot:1160654-Pelagomonas_calceolata.AAC.2
MQAPALPTCTQPHSACTLSHAMESTAFPPVHLILGHAFQNLLCVLSACCIPNAVQDALLQVYTKAKKDRSPFDERPLKHGMHLNCGAGSAPRTEKEMTKRAYQHNSCLWSCSWDTMADMYTAMLAKHAQDPVVSTGISTAVASENDALSQPLTSLPNSPQLT